MKKYLPILGLAGVVLLFFLIFYLWGGTVINGAVSKQESVEKEWADVQAQYQRRADLIPNLVATVKGAADNEKEILIRVTEARAGIATGNYTTQQFSDKIIMENYPEIKSTENFRDLQRQLEGTENRVAKAREDYNEAVKVFNSHIRGFFKSKAIDMLSEDGEFAKREMFEAESTSANSPDVKF